MTDITQTPDIYPEGIYQLAVTDPVLGGPEGPDNKAAIALANRTNYQRMRNVTPWRAGLENPYPAHAYVQHAGVTWKSKVANANIEPGTDATKWIRWAYTEDELLAFLDAYIISGVLSPYALDIDLAAYLLISEFDNYVFNKGIRYSATVCPAGGPSMAPMSIAAPTLVLPHNVYKSALGEVWMYLDNTWRVVAGHYGVMLAANNGLQYPIAPGAQPTIQTFIAPRAGRVHINISMWGATPAVGNAVFCEIRTNAVLGGAQQNVSTAVGQQQYISAGMIANVSAGLPITTHVYSSGNWSPFILSGVTYCD